MDKEKVIELIDQNTNAILDLLVQKIQIWSKYVLFSPLWWLGVALSVIPWFIWILLRKKNSTARLLYASFFVMVISLVLDVLGDQFGFWYYRFNVIPVLPTYLPWDCTLQPIAVLFLLQVKPRSSPLVKGAIFALLTSFVAEPIVHWMSIYELKNWKYYYSTPIQFFIYLSAHYLTRQRTFETLE